MCHLLKKVHWKSLLPPPTMFCRRQQPAALVAGGTACLLRAVTSRLRAFSHAALTSHKSPETQVFVVRKLIFLSLQLQPRLLPRTPFPALNFFPLKGSLKCSLETRKLGLFLTTYLDHVFSIMRGLDSRHWL